MTKIVTKETLERMLADESKRSQVIGRALVALFNRQVEDEKSSNTTNHTNHRGFAQSDAKQGSISAKTFLRHGELRDFQIERWMKPRRDGSPYLCKYARQLNEIAQEKAARQ